MAINIIEKYLNDVNRYLKPMIRSERDDIIQEIRSEIFELENAGITQEDIIERLGSPKLLAKSYIEAGICNVNGNVISKIFSIIAYVFIVGFSCVFALPFTVISGITFLVAGVICPVAGIIKLVAYLMGHDLQNIEFSIGGFTANAWEFLPISFALGALMFGAFYLMLKVTILLIKYIAKGKKTEVVEVMK